MSSKKIRKPMNKASARAKARSRTAGVTRVDGTPKGSASKAPPAKQPKGSTAKKPGGLTVAYEVLRSAKEPMRCKDIVEAVLKRGLWATSGKTPTATFHAAMIREIAAKGPASRFKKVGRGLFAAAKGV